MLVYLDNKSLIVFYSIIVAIDLIVVGSFLIYRFKSSSEDFLSKLKNSTNLILIFIMLISIIMYLLWLLI